MKTIVAANNAEAILKMYKAVANGVPSEARGQKTRNVRNLAIVLQADHAPITSFDDRKLNLHYCKREWIWYLGADPKDDSIEKYATMWAKLKQADGTYYSNYGQYIFGGEQRTSQFKYCLNMLRQDHGTRKASMVLLKADHLYPENTDTVCTYAINFTIEENQLHMTVMMRSNDVIYGFTNDAFCFQQLYSFMYALLKRHLEWLRPGTYTHFSNSMHVYERHFEMIENIVRHGMARYQPVNVPPVTAEEAAQLIMSKGVEGNGAYSSWLLSA